MNQNVVIAIVLGALVLIAAVQAYQLVGLKENIASGGIQMASGAVTPQAGGGSGGTPTLPSSLDNLPGMVGGC